GARRARAGRTGQGAAGAQRGEPRAAGGGRVSGGGPPKQSIAETVQTTDGFLRHAGREFLVVLYTAFRSLKLYPVENAQVQKALDDLAATTKHLLDVEKELELRLQGEFLFVNATRLRLDLDNYASFSHILGVLRQCGIGAVRVDDEYTFTHSVNVCIFSVALGRKLGLTKLQLYDLGIAALFHDVGKSRVPLEVLNKQGGLTDEEWRIMQAHPWLGVLTLFGLRGYGEI